MLETNLLVKEFAEGTLYVLFAVGMIFALVLQNRMKRKVGTPP